MFLNFSSMQYERRNIRETQKSLVLGCITLDHYKRLSDLQFSLEGEKIFLKKSSVLHKVFLLLFFHEIRFFLLLVNYFFSQFVRNSNKKEGKVEKEKGKGGGGGAQSFFFLKNLNETRGVMNVSCGKAQQTSFLGDTSSSSCSSSGSSS